MPHHVSNRGYFLPVDELEPGPSDTSGSTPAEVGFGRILRYFLKLGTIGFGGPIATVGYMQCGLA
jgi:hypothetical protein